MRMPAHCRWGSQIRDWLRVLEVPVADLCYTGIACFAHQEATSLLVAKNGNRPLGDWEPVPVLRPGPALDGAKCAPSQPLARRWLRHELPHRCEGTELQHTHRAGGAAHALSHFFGRGPFQNAQDDDRTIFLGQL